jgi:hypothetical protein
VIESVVAWLKWNSLPLAATGMIMVDDDIGGCICGVDGQEKRTLQMAGLI